MFPEYTDAVDALADTLDFVSGKVMRAFSQSVATKKLRASARNRAGRSGEQIINSTRQSGNAYEGAIHFAACWCRDVAHLPSDGARLQTYVVCLKSMGKRYQHKTDIGILCPRNRCPVGIWVKPVSHTPNHPKPDPKPTPMPSSIPPHTFRVANALPPFDHVDYSTIACVSHGLENNELIMR